MELLKALNWRNATKKYNPTKKISQEDMEKLLDLLQLSSSSTNIQPWHFIVAASDGAKAKVAKSTEEKYPFNTHKIVDASAVIIFATKFDYDDKYLQHILEKEEEDGRIPNDDARTAAHGARALFTSIHKDQLNDYKHWADKQVYLNLGNFLLGAALLEIDATPMEGFDAEIIDKEFALQEKGFASTVLVSVGYRADDDFNGKSPKSRLAKEEIIEIL